MKRANHLRYFWLAASVGALTSLTAQAQPARPAQLPTQVERRPDGSVELIRYERGAAPAAAEAPAALRTALGLSPQNELRPAKPAETDDLGFTHQQYQQYYQGVPVEFTAYTTHCRAGAVESMTGETRAIADGALDVHPARPAAAALRAALAFVHADQYQWELPGADKFARESEGKASFRPTGELVIVENALSMDKARRGQPVLAWKFNIYAAQPLSRAWVYVDARTGEVVNQDAIIKHANAMVRFDTKYSGTTFMAARTVSSTFGPVYQLRDATHGQGIETYNIQRTANYGPAVDFSNLSDRWLAAQFNNANQDWVAGDAHFGAQQTYDYWSVVHGRQSFDGNGARIKSYVHYDDTPGDGHGYDNAFWNGSVMSYGDGDVKFKPLTSVDICAHELGHAVCQYTAGLQYQNEPGALNEGFSDIWAACVEDRTIRAYTMPGKNPWLIGEQIMKNGQAALRSMSNPNQFGQADTYLGTNWQPSVTVPTRANDFGGVHTNSGVLNYWFYLLSQGGSGTNDLGNPFVVNGVTIDHAAKIAYYTEKHLSATSTFASARTFSLQAASDLYGNGTPTYAAVMNAWYAVGIGGSYAAGSNSTLFIDAVSVGRLTRLSTNDPTGYYDGVYAAATTTTLTRCAQYPLVLSAGFSGPVVGQFWNVYLDFNHDQDFNDADERVVSNKLVADGSLDGSLLNIPSTAPLGATRMRVTMSTTANNITCGSVGSGEVEDYPITIGAAVPVATPTSLRTTAISNNAATIEWGRVLGAATYRISYRATTQAVWTTVNTPDAFSSYALSQLLTGTAYEVQVEPLDACSHIGTAATLTFSTTAPTHHRATNPTGTTPDALAALTLTAGAYPNPAQDVLRLTLTDGQQAAQAVTSVDVFDQRGARIQSVPFEAATGTLRIESLKPGLYTATVRGAAASAAKPVRFVKE